MVTAATEGPTNPAVYPEQPRCPLSAASLETLQETDGESKEEGGDRWGGEEKRRKADRRQEGGRGQRGRERLPGTEPFLDPTTYTGLALLSLPDLACQSRFLHFPKPTRFPGLCLPGFLPRAEFCS